MRIELTIGVTELISIHSWEKKKPCVNNNILGLKTDLPSFSRVYHKWSCGCAWACTTHTFLCLHQTGHTTMVWLLFVFNLRFIFGSQNTNWNPGSVNLLELTWKRVFSASSKRSCRIHNSFNYNTLDKYTKRLFALRSRSLFLSPVFWVGYWVAEHQQLPCHCTAVSAEENHLDKQENGAKRF